MSAADAADVSWPEDAVEVGRIVDAYGVKGWIKVQPYSSDPQALYASRRWFLSPSGDIGSQKDVPALLRVNDARDHGGMVVAHADEIGDRQAAQRLRGARVFVSRASFPSAASDEFYWVDLIGLQVVNRQGETLGEVAGLLDTGAHSVLSVAPHDAQAPQRLIPFVAAYVDDVDLGARRITVDWGLDY